jgi:hypothetical protein
MARMPIDLSTPFFIHMEEAAGRAVNDGGHHDQRKQNNLFCVAEKKYSSTCLGSSEPLREDSYIRAEYRKPWRVAFDGCKNLALEKQTWVAATG